MFHTKSITISTLIYLCAFVNISYCLSLRASDSKKVLTKRDSKTSDFFPDWVPFKNKHGEELGEFSDVTKKRTLKKRLALPFNYQLRADEDDNDEYFDKGGGNDGEDYFEKPNWSDLHRTPVDADNKPILNHKDLEDVDGIEFKKHHTAAMQRATRKPVKSVKDEETSSVSDMFDSTMEPSPAPTRKTTTRRSNHMKRESAEVLDKFKKKINRYEDEIEYEDGFSVNVKKKSPEIVDEENAPKEHEKRVASFDIGDDIKSHHHKPKEQRIMSEKLKEEELSREEHDRTYGSSGFDKYGASQVKHTKLPLIYDEYDDMGPEEDKYKLPHAVTKTTAPPPHIPHVTTPKPKAITIEAIAKPKTELFIDSGKLSLFRNPNLFMVYEDQEGEEVYNRDTRNFTTYKPEVTTEASPETTTVSPSDTSTTETMTTTKTRFPSTTVTPQTTSPGHNSVYTAPWHSSSYKQYDKMYSFKPTAGPDRKTERISLVPISPNLDQNGPALFFPKTRKIKPRNNNSKVQSSTRSKGTKKTSVMVTNPETTAPTSDFKDVIGRLRTSSNTYGLTGLSNGFGTDVSIDTSGIDTSVFEPSAHEKIVNITTKGPKSNRNNFLGSKSKMVHRGASDNQLIYPLSVVNGPSAADSISSAADAPLIVESSTYGLTTSSGMDALSPTHTVAIDNIGSTTASDAISAPSEAKTETHQPEQESHESGGGKEHEAMHEEERTEGGKKAYEGFHKDSKSGQGHHDREDHLGKYSDHGGFKKQHHDESAHNGEHNHEERGKKHAEYEESGKHSKGHSTKGSHDIHKKEEYEKKVEFFEEDGDSGEEENHGGHHSERGHKKGGSFLNGNHNSARDYLAKGDTGRYERLLHNNKNKGHRQAFGGANYAKRQGANSETDNGEDNKHWIYHIYH